MTEHYCANCRYWAELPDSWHCSYCLNGYYALGGRMPTPADSLTLNRS